jgi:LytS/YehU family sensor histidine kinase
VQIEVEPGLRGERVPRLLLQPLVENAIRHGLAPKRDGGSVRIAVRRDGERLRLTVSDDGVGGSAPPREGIGLGNLRRRLDVLYRGAADMAVEGHTHCGFEVRLDLPPPPAEFA